MTSSDELRALIDEWRGPARKRRLFSSKSKNTAVRLNAARRLAELASDAVADDALVDALERAAAECGDDRTIRRAYSRALSACGRIGEAIGELEERLEAQADDAQDLVDVSALYERAGRHDLAVDRLRRAVDIHIATDDLDAAVGAARRMIALEPSSLETASDVVAILRSRDPAVLAEGIEHLADVYRERGKLGQEAGACSELLALRPERQDVRDRLSSIYTRILEVDPDDQDAWIGLAAIDEPLAGQLRVLLDPEPHAAQSSGAGVVTSIEIHKVYAIRKAQELMDAGDVIGASLCLERAVQTNPDPRVRLKLARCYEALHRETDAGLEGLRALAIAHAVGDHDAADESLEWLAGLCPAAQDPLADAVFLNHRPESADVLYEELLELWDRAPKNARGVGAPETPN